ncbi:MAG: ROK family protein [Clostridia bacterium]|nr:ROK family protein [Clostridia bacterium]
MKNYVIGIDIGGTYIKGGIIKYDGTLVAKDKLATPVDNGINEVVHTISRLIDSLIKQTGIKRKEVIGVGIGSAGAVDRVRGEVCFAANLGIQKVPLAHLIEEETGFRVKIANDANCACVGEWKFGNGKAYSDLILVTLGTGVGGGIILSNRLFEGNCGAGGEIGHMLLNKGGRQCSCGRKGCLEAYASATALVQITLEEMKKDKFTKLWNVLDEAKMITPQIIFEMAKTDKLAKKIVDDYIENLGEGLVDLCNIFRPQAIIIGGGMSAQGENLIAPLRDYVANHIFAKDTTPPVDVVQAKLGNDAGVIGAASLFVN